MTAGVLLLSGLVLAAPPDGPTVAGPRLARGDELVYAGEVTEAGERVNARFRKRHELEVRVFVLDARPGAADCAVLTRVRTPPDPAVASPAAVVTGADPARKPRPPAVRLDLIRVDARGRVRLLTPPPGPPPIPIGAATATSPAPPVPVDTVPAAELGMFVPLPAAPAAVGATWETAEADRPPVVWKAAAEGVWNGGRVIRVTASQQTDGYDRPAVAFAGWQRTETIEVPPADGYACTVARRVERREGGSVVGWVEVRYELRPPHRYLGPRYADARREVEAAYSFADDLARARDGRELRARLAKIDRYLDDHPTPTAYREAVEAVRRRCEAATRGEALPTAPAPAAPAEPAAVGKPAPDFVAPLVHSAGQFRLSAGRGKPAVLVFYKPGSGTSAGSLRVAEALHRVYAGKLTVAGLAVSAGPDEADQQRAALGLTVAVADGSTVRGLYGIDTYPKFFVIDADGQLVWQFDGYGPETGYLVKGQVERLLANRER